MPGSRCKLWQSRDKSCVVFVCRGGGVTSYYAYENLIQKIMKWWWNLSSSLTNISCPHGNDTLPETNIAPENWCLEDSFPFGSRPMLVLGMVHFLEACHWETAIHMFYPAVRSGWLRHGRFGSVKSTALVFFFNHFFWKGQTKIVFLLNLSTVFFLNGGLVVGVDPQLS